MRRAFARASAKAKELRYSTKLHVLEIKENVLLQLSEPSLTGVFEFDVVKISDSRVGQLNSHCLDSTSSKTQELVLMDVLFVNNLDDGEQLFALVRRLPQLRGIFIISTNLRQLPSRALLNANLDAVKGFGEKLHVVRVCNSLLQSLDSNTFADLPALDWIDLADNRIYELHAGWLKLHENARISSNQLKITLSGNRLTEHSVSGNDFLTLQRPLRLQLDSNRLQHLPQAQWQTLFQLEIDLHIQLQENPFVCDCEMRWLANEPRTQQVLEEATCNSVDNQTSFSVWTNSLYSNCQEETVERLLLPNGDVHRKCCRQIKYRFRADDISGRLSDVAEEKQQLQQQEQAHKQQHEQHQLMTDIAKEHNLKQEEIKSDVQVETEPERRLVESLLQQKQQLSKSLREQRGYRLSEAVWSKSPLIVRPLPAPLRIMWSEARVQPLNRRTAGELSELASRSESRPVEIETVGSASSLASSRSELLNSGAAETSNDSNAQPPTNNVELMNGWSEPAEEEIGFQS